METLIVTIGCLLAVLSLVAILYVNPIVDNFAINSQRKYNLLMALVALHSATLVACILQLFIFPASSVLCVGILTFVILVEYRRAEEFRKNFHVKAELSSENHIKDRGVTLATLMWLIVGLMSIPFILIPIPSQLTPQENKLLHSEVQSRVTATFRYDPYASDTYRVVNYPPKPVGDSVDLGLVSIMREKDGWIFNVVAPLQHNPMDLASGTKVTLRCFQYKYSPTVVGKILLIEPLHP